MNHVLSPNRWSCVPASFATVMGVPFETLIELVGHDGSEIIFPDLDEPYKRRAFMIDELVRAAFVLGFWAVRLDSNPVGGVDDEHWYEHRLEIEGFLRGNKGVVCGKKKSNGVLHAVAWDGIGQCYDPNGFIYPIDHFDVQIFVPVIRVESSANFLEKLGLTVA